MEVQITNPRKFYLELVGRNTSFTSQDLKKRLTQKLISKLEPSIITNLHSKDLSTEHLLLVKNEVEQQIQKDLKTDFYKQFGIVLVSLSIS